ncbi:MAG: hypothetical protein MUF72_19710 [Elainella sp. Prado103]|jgi:hypothetical protein|nr:hypothetical protein [Elainella sp. Prado103]
MRDRSDRYQIQSVSALPKPMKKLGGYLVEAGLLTADQINVVLNDQQATGMRFGEIVAARGWVKEQTIEWIVARVVEPERRAQQQTETRPTVVPRTANGASVNGASVNGASVNGAKRWDTNPPMPINRMASSSNGAKNGANGAPLPPPVVPTTPRPVPNQPAIKTAAAAPATPATPTSPPTSRSYVRREVPISKPLPSVGSSDGDVNWVG